MESLSGNVILYYDLKQSLQNKCLNHLLVAFDIITLFMSLKSVYNNVDFTSLERLNSRLLIVETCVTIIQPKY